MTGIAGCLSLMLFFIWVLVIPAHSNPFLPKPGDEIQLLYCAADATIPGLATGVDAKFGGGSAGQTSIRFGNAQGNKYGVRRA